MKNFLKENWFKLGILLVALSFIVFLIILGVKQIWINIASLVVASISAISAAYSAWEAANARHDAVRPRLFFDKFAGLDGENLKIILSNAGRGLLLNLAVNQGWFTKVDLQPDGKTEFYISYNELIAGEIELNFKFLDEYGKKFEEKFYAGWDDEENCPIFNVKRR